MLESITVHQSNDEKDKKDKTKISGNQINFINKMIKTSRNYIPITILQSVLILLIVGILFYLRTIKILKEYSRINKTIYVLVLYQILSILILFTIIYLLINDDMQLASISILVSHFIQYQLLFGLSYVEYKYFYINIPYIRSIIQIVIIFDLICFCLPNEIQLLICILITINTLILIILIFGQKYNILGYSFNVNYFQMKEAEKYKKIQDKQQRLLYQSAAVRSIIEPEQERGKTIEISQSQAFEEDERQFFKLSANNFNTETMIFIPKQLRIKQKQIIKNKQGTEVCYFEIHFENIEGDLAITRRTLEEFNALFAKFSMLKVQQSIECTELQSILRTMLSNQIYEQELHEFLKSHIELRKYD